ncbi:DoxX family protein [Ideonella sp. 4Y16]|uniref:DoxX family protein n=1 Tax=Ideonella alba TaxID=2824118 RepID=UPI001B3876D5|nr:DoxX family protein [Ideonella alba]MBQ0942921.1 DoxX family protein [Ideonella alba]
MSALSLPTWVVRTHGAITQAIDGLGLLALRLWLAQEFGQAGWTKLSHGLTAPEWFAGLAFPGPLGWLSPDMNWLMAGVTEVLGAALLVLGWPVRLAALALLFVDVIAVWTVHFDLGWAGWNQIETDAGQGFKLPLMMGVMLLAVLSQGAGRWAWRGLPLRQA